MFTNIVCKKCNKCGEEKPLDLFAKNRTRKDGHGSECNACIAERARLRRLENPEKQKAYQESHKKENAEYARKWRKENKDRHKQNKRRFYLKDKYNITLDVYDEMRNLQDYKCYICGKHENDITNAGPTALNVDHCHDTGVVRKLLCMSCNIALGKVNDDVEILQRCIDYIKEHKNGKSIHDDGLQ